MSARIGRRLVAASSVAAAALAFAPPSSANEADTYGLGSRSTAMGGAVAADVSDFSANYYNPAGLVAAKGVSLSVGYVYAWNHLSTNDQDNHVANVHGLVGGIVAPGTFFKVPFAFGIGTYMPDDGLSRVKALRQETPRWALYDERATILFLAANLSIRPTSWLEIGGGPVFLAATHGRFEISGTANVAEPYASVLRHEVDADLTSVRYPQLGARFKLGALGYLALAYRGETKLQLDIAAHLSGKVKTLITVPLLYDLTSSTVDAFLPQQGVLGLSFQKIERLHVNFDLTFVNWAAYESPTAKTNANLQIDVPPGLGIVIPQQPKPTTIIPPAFSNRFVPRIGFEYVLPLAGPMHDVSGEPLPRRMFEVPLRAGYVYEASPVPPQTGVTNFVDADRHTISAGTGLVVNAPTSWMHGAVALDVHAQLSILPDRLTLKTDPADFVGDYRAGGTMIGIGSTLTARF